MTSADDDRATMAARLRALAASWAEPVNEATATHDELVEQTACQARARELLAELDALPVRRLTVIGASYGDQRLLAHGWLRDEREGLVLTRDGQPVAEFHPGQWAGVIDEAHRDPGLLEIARGGLDEVRHAIRQVPLGDYGDEDLLAVALRRVDEIADRAYSASYLHNHEEPF